MSSIMRCFDADCGHHSFQRDPATLAWVLEGFTNQELAAGDSLEVRIYGDGVPTPPVPSSPNPAITFSASSGKHVGVAEAKNILLRNRPSDVLVMCNADTRPAADLVSRHVSRLMSLPQNSMVLGPALYELAAAPTVFDILKEQTPMIFFYNQLKAQEWYDFRHGWTLNVSVRYADLDRIGFFNPLFRPWGFEDLELGFRLMGNALQVFYDPACSVTHRHPMLFDHYLNREELLGVMAPILHGANPAAFKALYNTDDLEGMATDFRRWVEMDLASHTWTYRRMREWCDLPAALLGRGDDRSRLLMTLYQMHVPLKRFAFRIGFLRGITMRDDSRWQERLGNNFWRETLGLNMKS